MQWPAGMRTLLSVRSCPLPFLVARCGTGRTALGKLQARRGAGHSRGDREGSRAYGWHLRGMWPHECTAKSFPGEGRL
jgi:hypothetical protein